MDLILISTHPRDQIVKVILLSQRHSTASYVRLNTLLKVLLNEISRCYNILCVDLNFKNLSLDRSKR